jgi:hypothetical protein
MVLVPNILAVFEEGTNALCRCKVYKSDGDFSNVNWTGNRYVSLDGEFKLIAAVWHKKFLRFEEPSALIPEEKMT